MNSIDYSLKFRELIKSVDPSVDYNNVPDEICEHIDTIGLQIESQKGVFTVLVTLFFYKSHHPSQDIRYHQRTLPNGFSGRSFDTTYITPVLKELQFPSMSESGWLTRSLEQPYPYDSNYNGRINNKKVKTSFLHLIDHVQKHSSEAEECLKRLIWWGKKIREKNKVSITPLDDPESITIETVMKKLVEYFDTDYNTAGGSKLPVICLHSLYKIIVKELGRYQGMELKELGYHTSSDLRSRSSGDIEILQSDGAIFESIEIKYGIEISEHIVNRAIEKIIKNGPKRYYILSTAGVKHADSENITKTISDLRKTHGCQVVLNGIVPTLKYYFRLISDLSDFINQFSEDILSDKEIKLVHKERWKSLIESENN